MKHGISKKTTIPILISSTVSIIAIGTIFYRVVEQFSWFDTYYFSIITLTTVGYGDISPQTSAGKIFTTIYVLVGVGIITAFITTFAQYRTHRRIDKQQSP